MARIFLNYRRKDEPGFTHALYARLDAAFPCSVFMDVNGQIPPGKNFVDVVRAQLSDADAVLAIIGPRWVSELTGRDPDHDFVIMELRIALHGSSRHERSHGVCCPCVYLSH